MIKNATPSFLSFTTQCLFCKREKWSVRETTVEQYTLEIKSQNNKHAKQSTRRHQYTSKTKNLPASGDERKAHLILTIICQFQFTLPTAFKRVATDIFLLHLTLPHYDRSVLNNHYLNRNTWCTYRNKYIQPINWVFKYVLFLWSRRGLSIKYNVSQRKITIGNNCRAKTYTNKE